MLFPEHTSESWLPRSLSEQDKLEELWQKQIFCKPQRYRSFSAYLQQEFGCKVYKVTVDAGFTCPNRDGSLATGGCIYCNAQGSGNGQRRTPIAQQVLEGIQFVKQRYKAQKIMVYFQAFTNTYASVQRLQELYTQALCHPDIVALAIGTRPDCIDATKLDMLLELQQRAHPGLKIWLEYGLESSHNDTLKAINRMHSFEQFAQAVRLTQQYPFKTCTHTILGLPGETQSQMLTTIKRVAELQLDAIKIHSLYIERNTALEKLYQEQAFELLTQQDYVDLVCRSLEILPGQMVIERMTGDALAGRLVAPAWSAHKHRVIQSIEHRLLELNTWQGRCSRPTTAI